MTQTSTAKNHLSIEQDQIKGVRVLVYGHDERADMKKVAQALDALFEGGEIIEEIIHDASSSIGKGAAAWAQVNGAMQIIFPNYWGQSDETKAPRLLKARPDFIVLFSDGQNDLDMVKHTDRHNIRVWQPHL